MLMTAPLKPLIILLITGPDSGEKFLVGSSSSNTLDVAQSASWESKEAKKKSKYLEEGDLFKLSIQT